MSAGTHRNIQLFQVSRAAGAPVRRLFALYSLARRHCKAAVAAPSNQINALFSLARIRR